jgi:hypothetical protein
MRFIRLYRFRPSSQPPINIKKIYPWFKEEVQNSSIEPIDAYQITEEGPMGGSEENLSFAKQIFEVLKRIKQTYLYLKQRM